jgi:hypothetical protein
VRAWDGFPWGHLFWIGLLAALVAWFFSAAP